MSCEPVRPDGAFVPWRRPTIPCMMGLSFFRRGVCMKRLIVCADGTWNRPDEKSKNTGKPTPTNVEKLHEAVPHVGNGVSQVVHYESGVGTGNLLDRLFGGAIGKGIDRHIRNCYQFLVDEYEQGDEI